MSTNSILALSSVKTLATQFASYSTTLPQIAGFYLVSHLVSLSCKYFDGLENPKKTNQIAMSIFSGIIAYGTVRLLATWKIIGEPLPISIAAALTIFTFPVTAYITSRINQSKLARTNRELADIKTQLHEAARKDQELTKATRELDEAKTKLAQSALKELELINTIKELDEIKAKLDKAALKEQELINTLRELDEARAKLDKAILKEQELTHATRELAEANTQLDKVARQEHDRSEMVIKFLGEIKDILEKRTVVEANPSTAKKGNGQNSPSHVS